MYQKFVWRPDSARTRWGNTQRSPDLLGGFKRSYFQGEWSGNAPNLVSRFGVIEAPACRTKRLLDIGSVHLDFKHTELLDILLGYAADSVVHWINAEAVPSGVMNCMLPATEIRQYSVFVRQLSRGKITRKLN